MGGISYHKNMEKGLWYEIKCLQDLVDSPTAPEKERKHAKHLLKHYRRVAGTTLNESGSLGTSKSGRLNSE